MPMTEAKVLEVVGRYAQHLRTQGFTPVRNHEAPSRHHLLWMCEEIPAMLAAGRREKVMRWLGFIQGALYWSADFTIDDLKRHNMPDESVASDT